MLVLCIPTAHAASGAVSMGVNKSSFTKGETVVVTVSLASNSSLAGVQFQLNYNSSQLEYASGSVGSAGMNFANKEVNKASDGVINGAFITFGSAVSGTGTLAILTFKVSSDSEGTSSLSMSASGTDVDNNDISLGSGGATIKLNPKAATTTTKPDDTTTTTTKPADTTTTTKPDSTTTTKPTTTDKPTTTKPEESTTKVYSTESIAVSKGGPYQLVLPQSMKGKVTCTSSNTSVATITNEGVVTALAKGMTTLKAVSENGVTKTWLLIVGDGSMTEDESTTVDEEESSTEMMAIGSAEPEITDEETTDEDSSNKKTDDKDSTFRLIFGTGAAVAVLIIIVVIASMIRKKRSFVG